MKNYTVKELSHLLDDYYIGVTFSENVTAWESPEIFETKEELVSKYGKHNIRWISLGGSEDDIYQLIEVEGDRK